MHEDESLPNGQLLLLDMPEAHEGGELLESKEVRLAKYPLTTIERDQERLQSILAMIAADAPGRYICRSHRVGWYTLQRIREEHGVKITTLKQSIARRMALFVQLGIEQLLDDLAAGNIEPDKLGILVGIITDKMQVLTGEPTVIHGNSEGSKQFSVETFRERLARKQVIDVTPAATGPAGGNPLQTREAQVSLPAPTPGT